MKIREWVTFNVPSAPKAPKTRRRRRDEIVEMIADGFRNFDDAVSTPKYEGWDSWSFFVRSRRLTLEFNVFSWDDGRYRIHSEVRPVLGFIKGSKKHYVEILQRLDGRLRKTKGFKGVCWSFRWESSFDATDDRPIVVYKRKRPVPPVLPDRQDSRGVRTTATFSSRLRNDQIDGDADIVQSNGKAIVETIVGWLREAGQTVSEPEDKFELGWDFVVGPGERGVWVNLSDQVDQWRLMTAKTTLLDAFQVDPAVLQTIHEGLTKDARFGRIRWFFDDEEIFSAPGAKTPIVAVGSKAPPQGSA